MAELKRADYQKQASPCCGRKPLIYMREHHQFCSRCCRAYAFDTEDQVPNWAWKHWGGEWRPTYPDGDYVGRPGRATLASATDAEGE